MREDIITEKNGVRSVDIYKATGKGYERGWFTNCHCRYRFFVGARNTKKSKDILGYEPIIKILSDARRNVLVIRQNDVDNRQSTFENISGCIEDLGLSSYFHITKNPLEITYTPTKQKIIFRGLNNPTSLNSITFAVGYLTDVYIEEAFEVSSYQDFRKLDGSLRGKMPEGLIQQITCCMNAWVQDCWIYHEFFKDNLEDDYEALENAPGGYLDYRNEDFIGPYGKGLYLHKSTFRINEFRDKDVYDVAAAEMKRKAPEIYKVEFLGCWGNATASCYPEYGENCLISAAEIADATQFSRCAGGFIDFAVGVDTGFSNGEGKKQTIKKGEDVNLRVKAATTMNLIGITQNYEKVVIIDEYFHSNDPAYNRVNTDNQDNLTSPQLATVLIGTLIKWIRKYTGLDIEDRQTARNVGSYGNLLRGQIRVYVDSADIGFRQMLEAEAQRFGLFNAQFIGSTKRTIQARVDFTRYMMAYGDWLINKDTCPNTMREYKNARRGEKGEARQDGDDHCLTSICYAVEPLKPSLIRYKNYKEH